MRLGNPPICECFILPRKHFQARSNNSYKQIALSPRQSKLNSERKIFYKVNSTKVMQYRRLFQDFQSAEKEKTFD